MATKFTGKQFIIGLGKETTRGTPVTASYWFPDTTLTIDDKPTFVKDETSVYAIEDGVGQEISVFESDATLEGRITDQGMGALLMALMGTDTPATVETGVKDHKFTVLQNAQHPCYSICAYSPNEGTGLVYPLAMLDSLDLTFDLDKYAMFKAVFKANKSAMQANTVSLVAENAFRPQDTTFGYAANLAGLSSPTMVALKKVSLSFKKNPESDKVLGNQTPADRLNKAFQASGSFELYYTDRTWIDTVMLGDLYKALQFKVVNSGVTIGTTSHPSVTINLAKTKVSEVARKLDNKGITSQTVKFTPFYSLSDSEMLDITLRNAVTTSY